jgi:Ring finger domain
VCPFISQVEVAFAKLTTSLVLALALRISLNYVGNGAMVAVHPWFSLNISLVVFIQIVSLIRSIVAAIRQCMIEFVLSSLKPPKVNQWTGKVEADDLCCICMEEMTSSQPVDVGETECGHTFHVKCLTKWLQVMTTCPKCRMNFV